MRMIGRLDNEKRAAQFGEVLFAQGIENEIEPGESGWIVWVVDEERLAEAKALLERFTLDPDNETFQKAAREGRRRWNETRREIKPDGRPAVTDMRTQWHRDQSAIHFPLTIGMLLVCIGVAVASKLGDDRQFLQPLFITPNWPTDFGLQYIPLTEVLVHGQLWRLVTPIFVHFSLMHILFNMMWLIDLGRTIETRRGTFYFAALVLVLAIPSNFAQYYFSGPGFGGMSGVVFGLIGYMWARNKFSYQEEYPLSGSEMQLAIVWFIVCAIGIIGSVANWAHGVGLGMGILIGYLFSHRFRRLFHSKA